MMKRLLLCLLGVPVAVLYGGALTPKLDSIVQQARPDTLISVIATTTLRADLSTFPVDSTLSSESIYDQKMAYLKQVAQEAQAELLAFLGQNPNVEDIESFWLVSRVAFRAPPEVIIAVAERSDVDYVTDDFVITLPEVIETEPGTPSDGPEWNISQVQADACWARGITGTGVVVGTIDTGVEAGHPAFHGRWRSTNGWYDAVYTTTSPYDDQWQWHGTHVMGIICGGDGYGPDKNDIGVAPSATFIAAKAFCSAGIGTYKRILKCFDWMVEKGRPDVLNNSWGVDRASTDFWGEVVNLRELGIIVVFAIGNSGPNGSTSMSPGSFPKVIGTGATDVNDNIAIFSSRGPAPNQSPWNVAANWPRADWNLINPAVMAPGVAIRSALAGGGYIAYNGTSMACAHVTGCVALMRQKYALHPNPAFNIITDYADRPPQSGTYPNNNYGWGRLNCLAAVNATPTVVGLSDIAEAIAPPQAKHITRNPRTKELYIVYQSRNCVYMATSSDGGQHWRSERVAPGAAPCIGLDYTGTPWVVYVQDNDAWSSLYCSVRRPDGTWAERLLLRAPSARFCSPSFVCSNWREDAVPHPRPSDMGYLVVGGVFRSGLGYRVLFVPFDTLYSSNGMYNYGTTELNTPSGLPALEPCISRTPGDHIHVTWTGLLGYRSTYYQTASTTPELIRNSVLPSFTPAHQISDNSLEASMPVNDAYSDFVAGLWRAGPMNAVGVIRERNRRIHRGHEEWSGPKRWSEGNLNTTYPAMSRKAGVWRQQFDIGYPGIASRFHGDNHPTRLMGGLYGSYMVDHLYPQADVQLAPTRGGFDTLRVIWTERLRPGEYAVCFAPFARLNADRHWFYNVACGQEEPSPYCVHRDGAMALDVYSVDYADSALVYRLSYLHPLYRYRIRALVYHQGTAPILEEFTLPVDNSAATTGTLVCAEPGEPVEVWLDVPPELYWDGVTDLVVHRLEGDYAVVAGIEVHEFEPVSFDIASGGQSAGRTTPLRPPAILGVLPNPFTRATTIKYQLFGAVSVSLRILDVSGRCVRIIRPDGRTGVNMVSWDGLDDLNRTLPSGIYFCQLVANGARTTAKVCLTR